MNCAPRPAALPGRERGIAMLLLVFLLMLGVASAGLTFYRPSRAAELADDHTADVFADVKAALIGYAARQGVFQCADPGNAAACTAELNASSKLGELPCPDTNNDGVAEAACATERLGRVPWKTLGIPEPRDNAGEILWYAVSLRFLNNASNPIVTVGNYVTSGALNSSTPGDVIVRGPDGTPTTSSAIAVIFSPGAVLGGQDRNPNVSATCTPGQPNLARNLCSANYLESFGTTNNAASGGPFIAGTPGNGFNDRLVVVSAAELMPILEMRLGKEMQALLLQYKYNSVCQCYPWADSWSYSGGIADVGVNRGRLPSSAEPDDWGTGTIPKFPGWLKDNDWHNQVYYSASKNESASGCLTCSASANLTVKSSPAAGAPTSAAGAVLITPGTPRPGVDRPFLPVLAAANNSALADVFASWFEDAENNNKKTCPGNDTEHAGSPSSFGKAQVADASCDTVVVPQSRAYDRDRLWVIAPETPASMCPRAGPALVRNTPCKETKNDKDKDKVKDICTNLAAKLQQCSAGCAAAARVAITPPCTNDSSSSQCPPAQAALLACSAP
jgi:hypothetical protein